MPREASTFNRATNHHHGNVYGGTQGRFRLKPVSGPIPKAWAELDSRHPAIRHGRTVFLSRVFGADDRDRVLIEGRNNAKIGNKVTKGAWSGMKVFLLSLEERATCPRSCAVWSACYGNAMPFAVRFRYDAALIAKLDEELRQKMRGWSTRKGFVVRLHVLGDFPDLEYVAHWRRWMAEIPQLRVWGYTAHAPGTEMGQAIRAMNVDWSDRWAVRFSVSANQPIGPMQATVVWDKPLSNGVRDGVLPCPQELGGTDVCATCGLCWSPEARDLRIAFMGHGRKKTDAIEAKAAGVVSEL